MFHTDIEKKIYQGFLEDLVFFIESDWGGGRPVLFFFGGGGGLQETLSICSKKYI